MKLQALKRRVQSGFTLVELAIVLVIAGLILVAVLRGTDAIQKAQVERMVSDLRGLQATLLEFQKRTGRLAGDCDNNGVLNLVQNLPLITTLLPAWGSPVGSHGVLDFQPANRVLHTNPSALALYRPERVCAHPGSSEENLNLVWNELRRAGVVDSNRLPRELARHSMGDVFLVGSMLDQPALGGQSAGVIVAYGIPVWMAEAVDASIDGAATLYDGAVAASGAARTGRVRLWAGGHPTDPSPMPSTSQFRVFNATRPNTGSYDQGSNDRDRLISISFQYTPNKLVR